MYPTLNMSLLAQPTTAAGGESASAPLLEGAEVDPVEGFQASLTRSLAPMSEGGKPLPLDGTTLPESALLSGAAVDGELTEAAPQDLPGSGLALPGIIVPDSVEIDIPVVSTALEPELAADSASRAVLPGNLAATLPVADPATVDDTPAPTLPAAAAIQRTLQTGEKSGQPKAVDVPVVTGAVDAEVGTDLSDRPPVVAHSLRPGQETVIQSEGPARATIQGASETRENTAQRPELAVNLAETQGQRSGEQRPGAAPPLPSLEPGAVLATPTRPTINIATPVQVQSPQSAPADVPIQTPVGEPGFDDAIADRVWVMTQARLSNAEIRLTPAELGPVRIQVAVDDGTANVTFQAAQAATREAIEQALPRLRELFAENGLSLGQASVGDDGVRDGNRETSGQASAGSVADESLEDVDNDATTPDAPRPGRAARSLVDTFA